MVFNADQSVHGVFDETEDFGNTILQSCVMYGYRTFGAHLALLFGQVLHASYVICEVAKRIISLEKGLERFYS